jgi:hypothetical protein
VAHPDRVRKAYEGMCPVCLVTPGVEHWEHPDGASESIYLGFKCVFCVLGIDPKETQKRARQGS